MLGSAPRVVLLAAVLVAAGQAATGKWGYSETTDEELGPADWKDSYPSCGGAHQSPINIPVRDLSHNDWGMAYAPLKYGGDCSKFKLKKLEDLYKWQINGDEHCTVKSINFDEREYALAQFHMHATSEHALDDYHYDAEIHFVHKDSDTGTILVTGVFLIAEPDVEENAFIKNLWNDLETGGDDFDLQDSGINYADLLNGLVAKSHLFNYNGSLTTPPCSEVVDWWVLNNPISISYDELSQVKSLYGDLPATKDASDNRPTQPLNDREIKYY
ncbi:carbonic anhydrase-like protein [Phytophthora cinnamomi]|uniref:carbonic anhydrase-like protein n=1 Tax=Phytophthora cinnamomi TaxID=4785 RepID=UPI003559E74C|nr:carbonic anhydrase-like protein [Phytophthora cinnamomi]